MPAGQSNGDGAEASTVHEAALEIEKLLPDEGEEPATDPKPADEPTVEEVDDETPDADAEGEGDAAEPTPDAESEGEEPAAPTPKQPLDKKVKVPVKVDGRDEEVTLEEALAGYSRTQDYTRKTMKHAEDVKAFEAERNETRAARQQYAEGLAAIENLLQGSVKEPDWDKLRAENPDQFASVHAAWQIGQKNLEKLRNERAELDRQNTADAQTAFQAHIAKERQKLVDAIPEWKDDAIGKKERTDLHAYAKTQGFSDDDLNAVADHRAMVLLRKAWLYDQGIAKATADKAKGKAKVEAVRTATPGPTETQRPRVTELTRRKQRLAQTGNVRDAASAIELTLD